MKFRKGISKYFDPISNWTDPESIQPQAKSRKSSFKIQVQSDRPIWRNWGIDNRQHTETFPYLEG